MHKNILIKKMNKNMKKGEQDYGGATWYFKQKLMNYITSIYIF
jgi:hypothetical protein